MEATGFFIDNEKALFSPDDILLNGEEYVKDKMSEDMQEVDRRLGDLETGSIDPLYMATLHTANDTIYRGDCIVFYGGVNGIVDFGYDASLTSLLSFLSSKNVTKLDFIIITHYHSDHCTLDPAAAFANLANSGIDLSDCKIFLPHKGIKWDKFVPIGDDTSRSPLMKRESDTIQELTVQSLPYIYPCNEEKFKLSKYAWITFYNTAFSNETDDYLEQYGSEMYTDYYSETLNEDGIDSGVTTYNNFSLVAKLEYLGTKYLLTGDIHDKAQANIVKYIDGCDVYKMEHHGLNVLADEKWQTKFSPSFVMVCQYSTTYNTPAVLRPRIKNYCSKGAISMLNSETDCIVKLDNGKLSVENGEPFDLSDHLVNGGVLVSGVDLNAVMETGDYYCLSNTIAATLGNCPTDKAFRLSVDNDRGIDQNVNYRKQLVSPINKSIVYSRNFVDSEWRPWQKFSPYDYVSFNSESITFAPGNNSITFNANFPPINGYERTIVHVHPVASGLVCTKAITDGDSGSVAMYVWNLTNASITTQINVVGMYLSH